MHALHLNTQKVIRWELYCNPWNKFFMFRGWGGGSL